MDDSLILEVADFEHDVLTGIYSEETGRPQPLRFTIQAQMKPPRRYDPEVMGWAHEVLDTGQEEETDPDARRLIYDTTLRGYANTGHSYSDDLDDASVQALIEYLKTL